MLVTVIIPVFNTRPDLIERAVGSALAQTHPHLELLIVDDGSAAELGMFLDSVSERDRRIRVLHRTNGGVSAARNTGIENALGEFIAYLDADDYLEPYFLSSALGVVGITEADAVFGGIRLLSKSGEVEWRTGGPPASKPLLSTADIIVDACVRALSDSPSPNHSTQLLSVTNVVACLYRANTARLHRFSEGVSHAEDRLHNVHVLLDVSRVAFCSDVWYVYDATHDQGVTRRATTRTVSALARTVGEFAKLGELISSNPALPDNARHQILQAAAEGVFNYIKILSGVMAAVGRHRKNRTLLGQLLAEPSVSATIARANQPGWQNRVFSLAARYRQVDLLLLLGWFWMRTRGFRMSVERPRRRDQDSD
ncbi:glycosyltransferase [Pseudarthrobacter oxydans]|uniref:glycosyltransferase n=1 Tax=Pseudarthrobacter oxydans TaxID=1671 RepID=UPI003447B414